MNETKNLKGDVSPLASIDLLAVGSTIDRNGYKGKILAVGILAGKFKERYYWLEEKDGTIAMIPAMAIDG